MVEGSVKGDVCADKSVAVREHAQLTGNIRAPRPSWSTARWRATRSLPIATERGKS